MHQFYDRNSLVMTFLAQFGSTQVWGTKKRLTQQLKEFVNQKSDLNDLKRRTYFLNFSLHPRFAKENDQNPLFLSDESQ